jgi:hypothetical protein
MRMSSTRDASQGGLWGTDGFVHTTPASARSGKCGLNQYWFTQICRFYCSTPTDMTHVPRPFGQVSDSVNLPPGDKIAEVILMSYVLLLEPMLDHEPRMFLLRHDYLLHRSLTATAVHSK